MSEFENTSVEMEEVADLPEDDTGVEEQEVAEPESEVVETQERHKNSQDEAFADMRRQLRDAQRELAEERARNEVRDSVFSQFTDNEDWETAVLAEISGLSEDEVAERYSIQKELAELRLEKQQANAEMIEAQAELSLQQDLEAIRKIDPSLKSLEELGDEFLRYRSAFDPETGEPLMSAEDSYWAVMAKKNANKVTPPKEVGRVATGTAEKEYYTDAEIDAMSSEQLSKNWKKIMASWDRKNR